MWKELEILFSVWEDWAGKTFLEAKSYILKWLHTEFVACMGGCVSHLFQISPGCTDCPGTRAKRHFKDDITAAKQAASNSVLAITPISLLGREIWVIPKKSACSQPPLFPGWGSSGGSTEFLTSLVLPESIAQPHSKHIMNHSPLIDYANWGHQINEDQ